MMSDELRELPVGWKWKKIKDVCSKIITGGTPKRSIDDYFGGDIVWLRLADVHDKKYVYQSEEYITEKGLNKSSAKIIPENSVILSTRATIGEVVIAGKKVTTNQGFKSFVCGEELLPEYLYYYFLGNTNEIKQLGSRTTYPEVSKTSISNLQIPVPSLEEQKKIVSKLNELFSNLEVVNKLQKEADKIGKDVMSAAISSVLKLGNDNIQLPIDWELKTLGDVTNESRYGYTAKAKKNIEGVPYLRITDINDDGSLEENGFKYVNIEDKNFKKYRLKNGDIVIARSGATVGKNYLYESKDLKMVFASYLIRFRLNRNIVLPKYIYYYLNSHKYWYFINRKKRGGAQPNINAKELKKLEIPIPPLREQKKMIDKLDELKTSIDMIENEIKSRDNLLEKLPQSILKKAFAGEL